MPLDYGRKLTSQFKRGTVIGFPSNNYYTILGLRGWSDDSGGPAHELAFSNLSGISYRTGTLASGWSGWRKVLTENLTGNVGIGVDNPMERLAVNGKIRALEIKVEAANWPDYVFHSDYELLSLVEIEQFIKINGHLPEIPTANEIGSEGISLGEMNTLLLKKIEELTLLLIANDKELKGQKQEIEELKNYLETLKSNQCKN
ncbi:hypothetical protein GCM10011516_14360 [Sphingobacterium cellulitidis]|uniref:Peptidase S74 domain-containing protein n=2 Tax=Sphingobacterium cellulitidis TaxID=1768011 RepID=A0A8H9G1W7_9SPHI|nr:hypothetical protein GCM10011516_14360 [Sphingobacterium soli]